MEFMGYARKDGSVGIRNHVVVIPASNCANELAATIAADVNGAIPLLHDFYCIRVGLDVEWAVKTLVGLGANPNVHSALVVGIGCDKRTAEDLADDISRYKKPVEAVSISAQGTFDNVVEKGQAFVRSMVREAGKTRREPCDLGKLTLGIKCGGSHATSVLAGNPATGKASDLLIANGGTVIFSETAELLGAANVLAKRAVNQDVGRRLVDVVSNMEAEIKRAGVDIRGSEPTPANIRGGLTTIEEKSLGAIAKSGTAPLMGVLDYAEKPKDKGLYFMDGSALTVQLFLGMATAGAQIQIFIYGGDLPARFRALLACASGLRTLPTLKVLSSPEEIKEKDYFDVYAGDIVEGSESIDDVGERLFNEIIEVSSGKMTITETRSGYSEPLALYATGGGLLM